MGRLSGCPFSYIKEREKVKNMLKLKVKEKEYILKFGYRVLAKTTLLKDVVGIQTMFKDSKENEQNENDDEETEKIVENLPMLIEVNSNLVLAGLQRYHEEFRVDYDNPESVKAGLEKVYDFMDDYMDEEDSIAVFDLFGMMIGELTDNGFLSKKSPQMEQAATEQDATIIPMDHQKTEK